MLKLVDCSRAITAHDQRVFGHIGDKDTMSVHRTASLELEDVGNDVYHALPDDSTSVVTTGNSGSDCDSETDFEPHQRMITHGADYSSVDSQSSKTYRMPSLPIRTPTPGASSLIEPKVCIIV
jgi:hypothetical protein